MSADIKPRATNRGLRRCPSCGQIRGNRAKGCHNKLCVFHKDLSDGKHTVDAVELVSYGDSKIYSVRVKERNFSHRSFVQITDITLLTNLDSTFVSRNAICFVDTCKYDSKDVDISCKHVKGATECKKQAVQVFVSRDILFNMEISLQQKADMWNVYAENSNSVPPVQRINKTTFAVKCIQSAVFPAGRLHVTVLPNWKRMPQQLANAYSCSCKRLKISLTEESVVLQRDICEHLMFVLAAILSTPAMHEEFRSFMEDVKMYWTEKNKLLIFDSSLLPTEDINTYSDILNLTEQISTSNPSPPIPAIDYFPNDPTMVSNFAHDLSMDEENEINYLNITSNLEEMYKGDDSMHLELSDCNIELLDQFQLTDHIDLGEPDLIQSADDALLPQFDDCPPPLHPVLLEQPTPIVSVVPSLPIVQDCNVVPIKKQNILIVDPPVPPPVSPSKAKSTDVDPVVSVEFERWMDFLVEKINHSIVYDPDNSVVQLSLDVHETFFQAFSDRFTIAQKRRLPTSTSLIKTGKYKNLIRYVWLFYTKHTIKRIFTTDNVQIAMEKKFKKELDSYLPYDEALEPTSKDSKYKKILPKMCSVFVTLEGNNNNHKTGFKIEWIPNVYPQSSFGVLNIQFMLGFA